MTDENRTPYPTTWPDGWTTALLVRFINEQLEAEGSPLRVRLLPDDEPRRPIPPGVNICDVLKNHPSKRAGRNPGEKGKTE